MKYQLLLKVKWCWDEWVVLTDVFSFLIIADVVPPLSLTEARFVSNAIWLFPEHIDIVIKIAVDGLGRN